MKIRFFILMLAALGLIAILNSCAKAPQVEIDAAKAAIESARTAEANQYVANEFKALQDSLSAAVALIDHQNDRFSMLRNYDTAKQMLTEITAAAEFVSDNAAARKEAVIQEVQQSLMDVNASLKEANQLIARAPKGKEGRQVLMSIKSELKAVESSLSEVSGMMSSGSYHAALDKVTAGKEKVIAINNELKDAITKRAFIVKKKSM